MAQSQRAFKRTAKNNLEPGSERSEAFENPAPPESTNHDHPSAAGSRVPVPGAGIVTSGTDAGPVESGTSRGGNFPGHGTGPLNAPHAVRGTDASSGPPLSVPSDTVGPEPGPSGIPETSDPNYTAASERNKARRPGKAQAKRGRKD
jgi:hypothetical protein